MAKRTEIIKNFGFFNVDKPSGITSSTVVNKCKWLTGVPCGHMGTLDPLASGVLPVGVGNATRLFNYFLEKEKEDIDSTGNLIRGGHVPDESEISAVLPQFLGEIMQVPPKYSAKNVNGRRGYDLARAGIEFELEAKQVTIYDLQTLGRVEDKEDTFRIRIRCGGGTYIRSLARDIAEALGTKGVMSALKRTQSGIFTIEKSIPFSLLEKDPSLEELESYLIPTESVLPFERLFFSKKEEEKLLQGQQVCVDVQNGFYKIYREEAFYGLAEVIDGRAKAKTKLC